MNPLIKLIQINHSFQKSVNLQLDLDNYERIGSYIPTRSSIAILKRYWNIVSGKSGESASVLIGPYGKGKSHLLLVLLALLHGSMERDQVILGKIEKIDPQLTEEIRQWIKQGNKYLPVLVNSVSGTDLNQSFIYALQQALNREGLQNLAPADYYSEAVKVIENGRENIRKHMRRLKSWQSRQDMKWLGSVCGLKSRIGKVWTFYGNLSKTDGRKSIPADDATGYCPHLSAD